MKKKKTDTIGILMKRTGLVAVATILAVSGVFMNYSNQAVADNFDEKIKKVEREISAYEEQASELSKKADTLKNKIASLTARRSAIEQQINVTGLRLNKLKKDIKNTEDSIEKNRDTLGETIADIYVDDSLSPLEMLASSESIGDYIDKQEYRSTVKDTLARKIDEIKKLKEKLEEQKVGVVRTLTDQKKSREELVRNESEQAKLLADTQSDEAAYTRLVADKRKQRSSLQRQQQAAIEEAMRQARLRAEREAARNGRPSVAPTINVAGGSGGGGYPWGASWGCRVGADMMSNLPDPLGYYCRQCVSYTAWKTLQKTGYAPRYWGNANQWPAAAQARGFKTGTTPRTGALGVVMRGYYGHIVYVENYNAATGMVRISQYNYFINGSWGNYSEMTVPASSYDVYIYI